MIRKRCFVTIIIVAAGNKKYLSSCISSLLSQEYTLIEILVVNNSNSPIDITSSEKLKIFSPSSNLFYAGALNLGIKNGSGEFVLCLNDDVVLKDNFIAEALKGFEDSRVGMVSGKILRIDKKTIDSTGLYSSLFRTAKERGYGRRDCGQYNKEGYIFGVNGAVAFYRRSMLEQIKINDEYFDSDFRMFYEDLDLAWRAQSFGWKGYYLPTAIAYHYRGGSARTREGRGRRFARRYINDDLYFDLIKNRYLTIIKNENLLGFILHLPFILFYDSISLLYTLVFRPKIFGCIIFKGIHFTSAWRKRLLLKNKIKKIICFKNKA